MNLSKIKHTRKGQGGQVLAFALILMIIVVVCALVLFDTKTVIRGKVKGQNAVDAAALTGATWQQHALNLIGELNLVKASTVLLSDPLFGITEQDGEIYWATHVLDEDGYRVVAHNPDGSIMRDKETGEIGMAIDIAHIDADIHRVIREKAELKSAVGLLSQMQTRISFVLPLIGYGAAQQAAKNNGITYNADANETLKDLRDDVLDGEFYGDPDIAPQIINNYSWRIPYANMLDAILRTSNQSSGGNYRGVAVFSKVNWLGAPILRTDDPNALTPYIGQKWFYDAILSNSWCELKDILLGDYDFNGAWWGKFDCEYTDTFLEESEILPLHIDFFTGAAPYYNAHLEQVFPNRYKDKNAFAGDTALLGPYYDTYDPYKYMIMDDGKIRIWITPFLNLNDTDLNYNILPEFTWCVYDSSWTRYNDQMKNYWKTYLRDEFREGVDYYSGALSWFGMEQATKTLTGNMMNESGGGDLGKPFKGMKAAEKISAAQNNLKQGVSMIEADALAKPLGRIKTEDGSYKPPFAAGNLVLPVFTDVALIPISLEPVSGFEQNDKGWIVFLTKYVPLLGASDSLDEAWEKMIKEHPDEAHYCTRYQNALKKISDPNWREAGKNWLEKPVSFDKEGNPTSYNKDHCNDWPGGGSGHRQGPGSLH
ncbi:MAG: Tad domain-containing protein [Lentisphaeria bacterium]|nr:Tad domain-containing protein [Lentisphaeria bacterium]